MLLLSRPTVSKLYQPVNWNFFRLVISLNFFLENDRNYVSIIIIIISSSSNITVLVSHNGICFGYFMPMSHGVNKKAPPIHSVHWGISPLSSTPFFFAKPLLKSGNCLSLPLLGNLSPVHFLYPPLKINFFSELP